MSWAAKSRRVVIIHPSDEMYGADKVLLEAIDAAPAGLDIQVWLPTDVSYPRHELTIALGERNVPYRHLKLPILRRAYLGLTGLPGLLSRFFTTARLLLKAQPDLVYVNTAASVLMIPLARLAGAHVVLHLHEHLSGVNRITLPFVRFAHSVIAVSEAVLEPLPPRLRQRTTVIYNGFDLPPATPLPSAGEGIQLLIASRWNAWKGHETLLEAWDQVQRDDLRLGILGSPPPSGDAVDVAELTAAASRRGHTIRILGQTDAVRGHIDEVHVVVVPSVKPDPLPTIAIEALAAGRPVLGSNLGGIPEVVGPAGWLIAPGDVAAWKVALEALDIHQIERASLSASTRFEALFTRDRFQESIRRHLWEAEEEHGH